MERDLVSLHFFFAFPPLPDILHSFCWEQREIYNCTLHFIKANSFLTFIIHHSPCCLFCLFRNEMQRTFHLSNYSFSFCSKRKFAFRGIVKYFFIVKFAEKKKFVRFFYKLGHINSFLWDPSMHVDCTLSAILHNLRKGEKKKWC